MLSTPSLSGRACGSRRPRCGRSGPRALAASAPPAPSLPFRVGHGYDLHRLGPGLPLWLGGLLIPSDKGCEAHSDGDVLLHCVTDAVLGALALPDIGQLFPDTDPRWKGARSDQFLLEAMRLCGERGYAVGNVDVTVITEKPKLSPHKAAIRANLARLLGCAEEAVNVKAKTHEKVDAVGEQRAIECHSVILLHRLAGAHQ